MLKPIGLLFVVLVGLASAQDLYVLLKPTYQTYLTASTLKLSEFSSLVLAANGISVPSISWGGLKSSDPSQQPQVTLVFISDDELPIDMTQFLVTPIEIRVKEDAILDVPSITSKFLKSVSVGTNLGKFAQIFDYLPTNIASEVPDLGAKCTAQTFMMFFFKIDKSMADVETAIKAINHYFRSCVSDKKNDILSLLLKIDKEPKLTKAAKVLQVNDNVAATDNSTNTLTNLAIFYSDQYPAMFNLLFWTSLILAITVFGVAYMTSNMDPGLDTVIYRMTSQRIKKDN